MTAINPGDVDISLDGKTVTLRCTLRAAKEINALFGDYDTASRRLAAVDLNAYVLVVASGSGKAAPEVEEAVFRNGLRDLAAPLQTYLGLLVNGGRPVKPEPKGDETSGEG